MENKNSKNAIDDVKEHIAELREIRKTLADKRDKLRLEKSPMELDADPDFNDTIRYIEYLDKIIFHWMHYLPPKRQGGSIFPNMIPKNRIIDLSIATENIKNAINSMNDAYLEKLKEDIQYVLSAKCRYNLQSNSDISESTDDDEPDESFSIPTYKRNEELKLHKIISTGNVAAPYRLTYTCSNSNDKASREVTCYFMKSIKPSFVDDDVDKYHKIFTTENVCPVCGAHDGSCVCDPDDDTEYDEYTKEEMMVQLMKELE